jgi:hypothetical protein
MDELFRASFKFHSRYMVIPPSFDNELSKDGAKEKSLFSFARPEQAMNGLFRS